MRLITKNQARWAYTFTELLVVVALIVVLAALGMGAASKGYGWVKQRATETTMQKVLERFQRRIERLNKEAKEWPSATELRILTQAAGSPQRALALKVLYLYKWSFPNTYAEAFHNVQESRMLYDPANGYQPAVAILNKLRSGNPAIPDPMSVAANIAWNGGTPPLANIAAEIPYQSAACLLASFENTAASSRDELSPTELATVPTDQNQMLVDGWGSPFLFMRHGNFIFSRHRVGAGVVDRPAWWMGMVKPAGMNDLDFAPLEYILNPATNQPPQPGGVTRYYYDIIQNRAVIAYKSLFGRDRFDPNNLFEDNTQWRSLAPGSSVYPIDGWLLPVDTLWLAPTMAGSQHILYFRRTFGYSPDPANPEAYTPMFILSPGGDKIFNTWDDNLDSYRLQINLSGTQ